MFRFLPTHLCESWPHFSPKRRRCRLISESKLAIEISIYACFTQHSAGCCPAILSNRTVIAVFDLKVNCSYIASTFYQVFVYLVATKSWLCRFVQLMRQQIVTKKRCISEVCQQFPGLSRVPNSAYFPSGCTSGVLQMLTAQSGLFTNRAKIGFAVTGSVIE